MEVEVLMDDVVTARVARVPTSSEQQRHASCKTPTLAVPAAEAARPLVTGLLQHQAPKYVTYPYVLSGYRTGGTYARNLLALFEWHAETMNAWTMIIGVALSLLYLRHVLASYMLTWQQALPFIVMTASTIIHLPWTVGFHLFRGMNPQVYNLWRRLDQVFIFQVSILMTFATASYVMPTWAVLTWTGVAVVVACYASQLIWALPPDVQRDRRKVVALVGAIVACYYVPLALQTVLDVANGHLDSAPALWAAGAGASLTLGGYMFAHGIPERWSPYTFDLLGSSHQFMHVGAATAHFCEYMFMIEMLRRDLGWPPGTASGVLRGAVGAAAQLAGSLVSSGHGWDPGQERSWTSILAVLAGPDSSSGGAGEL